MNLPVNEPKLWGNESKYVQDCLDSNWFSSSGKYLDSFESEFAKFCDRKYSISVNNGTSALELACHALDLDQDDEVIIPSFSIISLAIAVIRQGGIPVPVDIEPSTWNIDPQKIQNHITKNTKAIIVVDTYGHPADFDAIISIAEENNLIIIEDAAESHGAMYKNKICGSFGLISTFSFYGNKLITTGEGGMVLTDNESLYNKMKSFKNLHFLADNRFHHEDLGYNFRMTNIQAAIGLAQLENIEKIISLKRKLGFYYAEKLSDISGIKTQIEKDDCKTVFWMYGFQLKSNKKVNAKTIIKNLSSNNIGCRPFFKGMHAQPALKGKINLSGKFPVTDEARKFGLYLPSGMTMTFEKIDYVIDILKKELLNNGFL